MKVLPDTQALLWFLFDDSWLSKNARESIVSTDAPIFVSPASIWEIAIKISLEKYWNIEILAEYDDTNFNRVSGIDSGL